MADWGRIALRIQVNPGIFPSANPDFMLSWDFHMKNYEESQGHIPSSKSDKNFQLISLFLRILTCKRYSIQWVDNRHVCIPAYTQWGSIVWTSIKQSSSNWGSVSSFFYYLEAIICWLFLSLSFFHIFLNEQLILTVTVC